MENKVYKLIRPIISNEDKDLVHAYAGFHFGEFLDFKQAKIARREVISFLEDLRNKVGSPPLENLDLINNSLTEEQCKIQNDWFEKREEIINSVAWPYDTRDIHIENIRKMQKCKVSIVELQLQE